MRTLIDQLAGNHPAEPRELALLVGLAVAAGTVPQILAQVAAVAASASRRRVSVLAARRLFGRTTSFTGLRFIEDPSFCDRLALAEQAAQTLPSVLTSSIPQVAQASIVIVSFVGVVYLIWPPMVLLLALAAAPSLIAQHRLSHQYADLSVALSTTNRLAIAQRMLTTDASAAKEMRLFGFGSYVSERYAALLDFAGGETLRLDRRNALTQSWLFILGAGVLGIGLWVVANGVRQGRFTVGDITLFVAAISAIQGAISGIVLRAGDIARGFRLFPNYINVVKSQDDLSPGSLVAPRLDEIEFKNVWFRYDAAHDWILRGVNLTLRAGTSTALVGMNGAGKTTLVKLMCRFHDPDVGAITWNGTDIRELDPVSLRSRITAVFQDHRVYELTAAENIGLGDLRRLNDRGSVVRAADRASIGDDISALPYGYDTLLSRLFVDGRGREGVALSGGQAQRLALARAYMRVDADLVLLDEPNSSLDAKGEADLLEGLRDQSTRHATVIVSHRFDLLRLIDNIVVLRRGQVVECGTHHDLLALGGDYALMCRAETSGLSERTERTMETTTL